ncbi:hypothetical protein NY99_20520 [Xanthomonas phaseoli pv. phaseoli]|nr:hypothetical protein NY99_20520 [Xanthomonas phaseoli pv. phaseoli]KHF48118.1 hypothetical protein QQ30_12595 [Xanthomonas phaseoli pv. phaseoli]KHS28939.1 hypothetical protein RM60_12080 [Xanthomonas phaseoli pv. phaseoli]OOX16042.1 hypothetical protein Xazr_14645 [Xanthomonas campestris pv. azadirachtae]
MHHRWTVDAASLRAFKVNIQIQEAQFGLAALAAHITKTYNRRLTTLEYLSALYPPTLSVEQVAQITGLQSRTIRNQLCGANQKFPVRSFVQGRKRCFALTDVAEYLDGLRAIQPTRRRGRPRKAEQIERQRLAAGG